MQRSFPQPAHLIETKTAGWEGSFREKSQKNGQKNYKLGFSEGHNFLCEKVWVFPTICPLF